MRDVIHDRRSVVFISLLVLAIVTPVVDVANGLGPLKKPINNKQPHQLRLKPKPSSSSLSGLPVPDLLESPDTKYDPKAKDIDNDALRLRLKGWQLLCNISTRQMIIIR